MTLTWLFSQLKLFRALVDIDQMKETFPIMRVCLVDVRSMQNVGATFRTADGAGFSEVITCGITGQPPDKRISKVALGAEEHLEHSHMPDIESLLAELEGDFVVVVEQNENSVSCHEVDYLPSNLTRISLIVGSEIDGVDPRLIDRADLTVEIPMRGMKESLNVSVAFGIAAYQLAHLLYSPTLDKKNQTLRSRVQNRHVRPGVLTFGVTSGQTPERCLEGK